MARDSMASIISYLRLKVNDVGSLIWTDDDLQLYLDMHRTHIIKESLVSDSNRLVYYSSHGMLELDSVISDSGGYEIPSNLYDVNFIDGIFTFSIAGLWGYNLDAKSYNVHGAIAECLEQLAMDPNRAKAWNRGSISYTPYDLMEMAKYHRNIIGTQSLNVFRTYRN